MHQKIRIIASLASLAASSIEARSAPANTLPDLWRELSACVKAPSDSAGSALTIVFALKRDGSLLGKAQNNLLASSRRRRRPECLCSGCHRSAR